jgi:hypothetical protein
MTHTNNTGRRASRLKAAMRAMTIAVGLSFVLPAVAYADPPDWAPAWGWRAKHDNDGYYYSGKKKHKKKYDDDYYYHDDDDDGRIVYRRDVVRCDVRRRDGTFGDLAGVLIDRTLGIPDNRRDNCYVTRSDRRDGFYWFDPELN